MLTPFDGALLDAIDRIGRGNAGRFEDGRHDVDHVGKLAAHAPEIGNMARPRNHHALRRSAEM